MAKYKFSLRFGATGKETEIVELPTEGKSEAEETFFVQRKLEGWVGQRVTAWWVKVGEGDESDG